MTSPMSPARTEVERQGGRATRAGQTCSSSGQLGQPALVPKVVAARSGRWAFNLAAASGPAPSTYFVLRRALEAGAKPRAVVVDFGPGLLAAGPERDVRNSSEVLGLREFLDLPGRPGRPLRGLARGAMPLALGPSRDEIRGILRAAGRGEVDRQAEINRVCRRNWRVNDGAHLAAPNPAIGARPGPTAPMRPGPDGSTSIA